MEKAHPRWVCQIYTKTKVKKKADWKQGTFLCGRRWQQAMILGRQNYYYTPNMGQKA